MKSIEDGLEKYYDSPDKRTTAEPMEVSSLGSTVEHLLPIAKITDVARDSPADIAVSRYIINLIYYFDQWVSHRQNETVCCNRHLSCGLWVFNRISFISKRELEFIDQLDSHYEINKSIKYTSFSGKKNF